MSKIYLPEEYVNMPCKVINNGYIRVYVDNSYTNYYDIYVNQDYMAKYGTTNYTQTVVCDTLNEYTTAYFYRTDATELMLLFMLIVTLCYFIVNKLLKVFFLGFREAL